MWMEGRTNTRRSRPNNGNVATSRALQESNHPPATRSTYSALRKKVFFQRSLILIHVSWQKTNTNDHNATNLCLGRARAADRSEEEAQVHKKLNVLLCTKGILQDYCWNVCFSVKDCRPTLECWWHRIIQPSNGHCWLSACYFLVNIKFSNINANMSFNETSSSPITEGIRNWPQVLIRPFTGI